MRIDNNESCIDKTLVDTSLIGISGTALVVLGYILDINRRRKAYSSKQKRKIKDNPTSSIDLFYRYELKIIRSIFAFGGLLLGAYALLTYVLV